MNLFYFTVSDLSIGYGGFKSHIEEILNGFYKQGWDLTLFSVFDESGREQPKYPFRQVMTLRKNPSVKEQLFEQFRLFKKLIKQTQKPDAFYIRSYFSVIVPYLYAKWKKIPYFVEFNAGLEYQTTHTTLAKLALVFENWVFRGAEGIFTTTEELKTFLVERTGYSQEKIHVIPMGFNLDHHNNFDEDYATDDQNRICYLGHFSECQGVETLIRALPLIQKAVPDVIVELGGGGEDQKKYESLISELGVSDIVTFPGVVASDKFACFFPKMKVAVAPYYGKFASELPMGSPTKIFTYLGWGVPSVISDLPSLDIFKDCPAVFYAKPDDPESFAEQIIHVLKMTSEERHALSEPGKEFVLDFSWDILAKRTGDIIIENIKNRKSRNKGAG